MPRRHGKRRYDPSGQHIKPPSTQTNIPRTSKIKSRRKEKFANRMGRDHTLLPKRVKHTLSNEERSLATKERKAESRKAREEQEAQKQKVMENLQGLMAQTKTLPAPIQSQGARESNVFRNLESLIEQTKHTQGRLGYQ